MRRKTDCRYTYIPPIRGVCNVTAAVVGGAGALISGAMQSSAASSAADAQQQSAQNATNAQLGMFNTVQKNLQPYMGIGSAQEANIANQIANGELGGQFTNADLNANLAPNFQFQLQQGEQALQNSQAAQNGVLSGAAQRDMQNFVQGTAAGAYQNAYANWLASQNLNYGQQMGLASLGENAAAQFGNNATTTGTNIGANMIGAGNAAAAGTIGSANAISGAVNNASGYYALNNMLGNRGYDPNSVDNSPEFTTVPGPP